MCSHLARRPIQLLRYVFLFAGVQGREHFTQISVNYTLKTRKYILYFYHIRVQVQKAGNLIPDVSENLAKAKYLDGEIVRSVGEMIASAQRGALRSHVHLKMLEEVVVL